MNRPHTHALRRAALALVAATFVTLAAAESPATTPPTAPASGFVAPNPNLHIEGIPPIPQSIADSVAKYTEFRGHRALGWHPKSGEMLVLHRARGASTAQLFWLAAPMAPLRALTQHADAISGATIEPTLGRYVVFESGKGGSEVFQLFRQDAPGQPAVQLTDGNFRHTRGPWRRVGGKATGELLVASVPLDRNLSAEARARIGTTYRLLDPLHPERARVIAELPGTGWFGGQFNRAGSELLLTRYLSANESEVWRLDVASGKAEKLLPSTEGVRATHFAGRFSRDGRGFFVISNRNGEFRELMFYDLATRKLESLTHDLPWDVEGASEDDDGDDAAGDGQVIYTRLNVMGRDELRAFTAKDFKAVPLAGVPEGSVRSVSTRRGSHLLTLNVVSAATPGDIYVYDPRRAHATQWSHAASDMDTSAFKPQQIITWKSFDGREISGLISRPPARFSGPRPVLISIHGGPEGQSKIGFMGRFNYFIDELGITVIQPNVRGSSGFGKTFLDLDNGFKREDSVKDIGALLDWIATQPDLDARRVLVSGGSYGGYMSLAVATHYADRIAGAIDAVGISHFVTFLETTESYRRDLRRAEYGDERDPKMREFLHNISPLTNADKIKKPLLVVQGRNDPRVPYTEAEQIVATARKNGATVWYLRAENEGHGFARKENADFYFYAQVRFMQETILK